MNSNQQISGMDPSYDAWCCVVVGRTLQLEWIQIDKWIKIPADSTSLCSLSQIQSWWLKLNNCVISDHSLYWHDSIGWFFFIRPIRLVGFSLLTRFDWLVLGALIMCQPLIFYLVCPGRLCIFLFSFFVSWSWFHVTSASQQEIRFCQSIGSIQRVCGVYHYWYGYIIIDIIIDMATGFWDSTWWHSSLTNPAWTRACCSALPEGEQQHTLWNFFWEEASTKEKMIWTTCGLRRREARHWVK